MGGGWALEIECFLGPGKWHRADRRVPFGAQKTRDLKATDEKIREIKKSTTEGKRDRGNYRYRDGIFLSCMCCTVRLGIKNPPKKKYERWRLEKRDPEMGFPSCVCSVCM